MCNEKWWPSSIEATVNIDAIQPSDWTHTADVVVVGYGGAGVCAALEAAESGLSVMVVDRGKGGGATTINGGVFYAGGGTATQKAAGVEDTVEAMYEYLKIEADGVVSDETIRRFCESSAEDHDWLVAHGVKFKPVLYEKKTSYPPTTYYLYHSDSTLAKRYADVIKPAARGHRVDLPPTSGAHGYGSGLYDPLKTAAEQAGVNVLVETIVEALVIDGSGTVVGVKVRRIPEADPALLKWRKIQAKITQMASYPRTWPGANWFEAQVQKLSRKSAAMMRQHGQTHFIRATKGVVIAAGGHIFNREMVAHFSPDYIKGLPLGTPADDGSGVCLGATAGGAMTGMERISAWRFINPPFSWARAPLINSNGERFVDETLYGAAIGKAMCDGRDGKAWVILDKPLVRVAKAEVSANGVLDFQKWPALMAMALGAKKASSLDSLANKISVPAEALKQSVQLHNAVAAGDVVDPYGKRSSDAVALGQGPYYAVNVSIDAPLFPLPTLTLGGLKVDEATGQVLRENGEEIAGLYAAGRSAIGICSNLYVSGLSVADCVFSGRRAAKKLASPAR